jgi:hypothetical protein
MASIISAGTTSGTALNMAGDTSGELQIATNGSTTAVTIDTSQNVGIGTTATGNLKLAMRSTVVGTGLPASSGTTPVGNLRISDASNIALDFGSYNTIPYPAWIQVHDSGDQSVNYPLALQSNGGQVFIGDRTGPAGATASAFYVKQPSADNSAFFSSSSATAGSNYGLAVKYTAAAPNGTGNEFLYCSDSSTLRASIRSNGGIANYQANNSNLSDQREKTNIELAGSYLDKVCAIPVKTFNYIDQNMEEDGGLTLGVIAQDVQAVAPELVMESNWASKDEPEKLRLSIYQTDLQYALMKCIQEQQTIINDLTARITALEGAA